MSIFEDQELYNFSHNAGLTYLKELVSCESKAGSGKFFLGRLAEKIEKFPQSYSHYTPRFEV